MCRAVPCRYNEPPAGLLAAQRSLGLPSRPSKLLGEHGNCPRCPPASAPRRQGSSKCLTFFIIRIPRPSVVHRSPVLILATCTLDGLPYSCGEPDEPLHRTRNGAVVVLHDFACDIIILACRCQSTQQACQLFQVSSAFVPCQSLLILHLLAPSDFDPEQEEDGPDGHLNAPWVVAVAVASGEFYLHPYRCRTSLSLSLPAAASSCHNSRRRRNRPRYQMAPTSEGTAVRLQSRSGRAHRGRA